MACTAASSPSADSAVGAASWTLAGSAGALASGVLAAGGLAAGAAARSLAGAASCPHAREPATKDNTVSATAIARMERNKVVPPEEWKDACVNVSIVRAGQIGKHPAGKTEVARPPETLSPEWPIPIAQAELRWIKDAARIITDTCDRIGHLRHSDLGPAGLFETQH